MRKELSKENFIFALLVFTFCLFLVNFGFIYLLFFCLFISLHFLDNVSAQLHMQACMFGHAHKMKEGNHQRTSKTTEVSSVLFYKDSVFYETDNSNNNKNKIK